MSPISLLSVASTPGLLAYLDPGSGSMAFQLLIAGMLSGMVFFKAGLQSVKRLWTPNGAK